ncbi:MCE family protein [Nocardioides stalactiti]|uniref:MCE family protein n=1 Tax=Nocardioides stalactiti TaxID=2755356 RepID=UPI001601B425|nr:MlaD family protein [Nocardioides stalactiti]
MIARRVKIQLVVFAVVTLLVVWYGATRYLGVGSIINPPYEVKMVVADPGGLYPRADVELLGTRVGRVDELRPGPGQATTVVLLIDDGVEISREVRGAVAAKSAIGEGYVALTPLTSGGEVLEDGDVIALEDTTSPIPLERLLGNLDGLARSIPLDDLETLLRESEVALAGIGPSLGRLVEGGRQLAEDALANIEDVTALIRDARKVLTTQVDLAPETRQWTAELAGLLSTIRALDPTLVSLYDTGLRSSTSVTNLLADNQPILPVLLGNLITVTEIAQDRLPGLRKTLTVFPWILENQVNSARFCDDYDPRTGEAVASTCHYDDSGEPIYTLHLSQQLDKLGAQRYVSCTKGYEGTRRYDPLGRPVDGAGPAQPRNSEPNLRAHCAALPTDPVTPNVRGAQNVTTPAFRRPGAGPSPQPDTTMVVYDPATGLVTDGNAAVRLEGSRGEAPPSGDEGLGWLLGHLLEKP